MLETFGIYRYQYMFEGINDGHSWVVCHFNGNGTHISCLSPEEFEQAEELFHAAGLACMEEMENVYSLWEEEIPQLVAALEAAGLVGQPQLRDNPDEPHEIVYPRG